MAEKEMLILREVYKTFNPGTITEKTALNGVNLTLAKGDFVTVIGGNGAGKSTMLNAIAGTFPVDRGNILLGGREITRLPEHKRAAFLGRVFQDPMTGTAASMNIEENLALANRRGQPRGLRWGITAKEREQYREKLASLDLGLENRLGSKVGLLSGGQRQALTLLMATLKQARAAAAGRAHRRPGPQDRREGAAADGPADPGKRAHRHYGDPQHEGRPGPGQPDHHDA